MSLRDDVLQFLIDNYGRIVTADQIMEAVGNRPSALRRLRELRRGDGSRGIHRWDIRSRRDESHLMPNEYRLASLEPLPPLPGGTPRKLLLDAVRQASEVDQLVAYRWLRGRYGYLTDDELEARTDSGPR